MPSLRLHPLLAVGAACLALAACGSDDDPPASQANAPAQTASTQAAPTQAPATTASDAPANTPTDTSATDAVKVRESLVALQEAFAARNGAKACRYMFGIPDKTDPKNPGMSCELLSQGPKSPLSEKNRTIAATAKVTVNGNEATAELRPGVPLKLRKIDGRWRVDYSQMGRPAAGSR